MVALKTFWAYSHSMPRMPDGLTEYIYKEYKGKWNGCWVTGSQHTFIASRESEARAMFERWRNGNDAD